MNLSGFFQTAATLSPILLAGTALTFGAKAVPKTGVASAVWGLILVGPPLFVTWYSLRVLVGFSSAETWRVPILVLLYVQILTGIIGMSGYVYVGKVDALRKPLLRKQRSRRQPHEPEETDQDEMRQPDLVPNSDAPNPDAQGPDETPAPDYKS